ncbi:MAG: hypothetical protein KAV99_05710 [Candidatus Latescibacteria bacterium]|nr:hypothetical protein [Candidatus Latescibacterota bacterium]
MKTNKMMFGCICLVFALLLLAGCAALSQYGSLERDARQHYQRGNYDQAVFKCAASLRIKPEYEKSQTLIQDALRAAVNGHRDRIQELEFSEVKFKWDQMVSEYEALVKLNQTIKNLPALVNKKTKRLVRFELSNYTQALAEAKTNAAETHYQEGLRLSQRKGLDFQKQAAKEFKAAQQFCPDYKDSTSRYQTCRRAGIKRVAIIPFEDKSGKRDRYGAVYGAISEMITDQMISEVMSDPSAMEFLELISRDQLEHIMREQQLEMSDLIDEQTAVRLGKLMGVHKILTGKITQIIAVPARTVKKTEKQEANVVVKTEKYTDSKGKKKTRYIRGDVQATVTFYTKTAEASIGGSYKIIDVETARIEKSESFTDDAKFNHQWATYSGDEKALDSKAARQVKRGDEPAPTVEQLVNQAARNLSVSLANSLKEYLR